jgi:hypothetical protein
MMLFLPLLAACTGTDGANDDTSGGGDGAPALVGPDIVINEFLAINDTVESDSAGEFDDWIELYNRGTTIVQLAGLYLTDDKETPLKWALPADQGIDAGDFLLVWADAQPEQGDLHTNFHLDKKGETLSLYYAEGDDKVRVDAIKFGTQQADLSGARVPDGSDADGAWQYGTPTPGSSNGG